MYFSLKLALGNEVLFELEECFSHAYKDRILI